jgi:2-polyprenyl-6-methoxyphenol hydroxylase-like FAD-dependent oxidoreductase
VNVGIVGGSLAGCAAAIALRRAGCEVSVYERSRGALEDRGAGIGMPLALLRTLVERDYVDEDMAYFRASRSPFVFRAGPEHGGRRQERVLWEQPVAVAVTNWGIVYRHLRSRVPDAVYRQGDDVIDVASSGNGASLRFAGGRTATFDLVVCADGQHSVGRRTLFPEQRLQYAGYVLWRGLADESSVADIERFDDRITWAVSGTGYCLLYIVPSRAEDVTIGKRQVNWVLYENVADTALPGVLTDARGVVHPTSLPPGAASAEQVAHIRERARQQFPAYVADVVCATRTPFIQAVFDVRVPRYRRERICLVGDAATVCRPHAASGAVKALTNALALWGALGAHGAVDDALEAWDQAQSAEGHRLVMLGQVMGKAFVQEPPAWHTMDGAAVADWWSGLMRDQHWYVTEDARCQDRS